MSERLTRDQLQRIVGNDVHAIRAFEALFDQAFDETSGDLSDIYARLDAVELTAGTAFGWGDHGLAGYIAEAPTDSQLYARINGAWQSFALPDIDFDDNEKLHFGTGDDAAIYYDGTDLYIDPKEVGAGAIKTNNGDINAGATGVIHTNEVRAVF